MVLDKDLNPAILQMQCSVCNLPCIILDRNYCIKEFVVICVDCFKKIDPKKEGFSA